MSLGERLNRSFDFSNQSDLGTVMLGFGVGFLSMALIGWICFLFNVEPMPLIASLMTIFEDGIHPIGWIGHLLCNYRYCTLVLGFLNLFEGLVDAYHTRNKYGPLVYSSNAAHKFKVVFVLIIAVLFDVFCVSPLDDKLFLLQSSPNYNNLIGVFMPNGSDRNPLQSVALYIITIPVTLLFMWQWTVLRFKVKEGLDLLLGFLSCVLYFAISTAAIVFLFKAMGTVLGFLIIFPIFKFVSSDAVQGSILQRNEERRVEHENEIERLDGYAKLNQIDRLTWEEKKTLEEAVRRGEPVSQEAKEWYWNERV